MTKQDLREVLREMSSSDLIRKKWNHEAILAEIRQEMVSRDARAVDEACALPKD